MGPFACRLFSKNTINVFSLPWDFCNNIFFSLAHFTIRISYIIHMTCKVCVNQMFMLFVVKFLGNQNLYIVF